MKRQEMEAVYRLTEGNGWKYLKKFIEANIENCNSRLSGHGKDFETLAELKETQGRKKAFQEVLNFVHHRKKKMENT